MNPFKPHILPLAALFITLSTAFVTYDLFPRNIPLVAYRYSGAIVVIYTFFRIMSLTDKRRTAQLETVGLFHPLRDGAFLVCTHAHLLDLSTKLGWLSSPAPMSLGTLSWLAILISIYAQKEPQGMPRKLIDLLPFNRFHQPRQFFCKGLFVSGTLGIIGTFVGPMPLAWLLIPLGITGLLTWRHAEGPT